MPRVSFVVPSYNETVDFAEAALRSVQAQTFADFECLVVDESTLEVSRRFCEDFCRSDSRFRYLRPSRRIGLAPSLNQGIENARGEYIARFDLDDICEPGRLAAQVAFLDAAGDIAVVGSTISIIDQDGKVVARRDYPLRHHEIAIRMHYQNALAHPAVMMRAATIRKFGGYEANPDSCEDLDLWLRLLNQGVRFANLSSPLLRFRHRPRKGANWRRSFRARIRNFNYRNLGHRVVGLGAGALLVVMSDTMRDAVYRTLMWKRRSGPAGPDAA